MLTRNNRIARLKYHYMNKIATMLVAAVFASLQSLSAQTENPRGIYRMVKLVGNLGEIDAPFEQYKICSDSITLTISVMGSQFRIFDNDHQVFNHTGSLPPEGDAGKNLKLVYDSDSTHFSMKWWSDFAHHLYFPHNDWCIEKYESSGFSETGSIVADALTGKTAASANPLYGTWSIIGELDELNNTKKQIKLLHEQYQGSKYLNNYMVLMPNTVVFLASGGGSVQKAEYEGKKSCKIGRQAPCSIKWLSKKCIALEKHSGYHRDWIILERTSDGDRSPLDCIITQYTGKGKRP